MGPPLTSAQGLGGTGRLNGLTAEAPASPGAPSRPLLARSPPRRVPTALGLGSLTPPAFPELGAGFQGLPVRRFHGNIISLLSAATCSMAQLLELGQAQAPGAALAPVGKPAPFTRLFLQPLVLTD